MASWMLPVARATTGALAALGFGQGLSLSLDGKDHDVSTYAAVYGGAALFALICLVLWVLIHARAQREKGKPMTEGAGTHIAIGGDASGNVAGRDVNVTNNPPPREGAMRVGQLAPTRQLEDGGYEQVAWIDLPASDNARGLRVTVQGRWIKGLEIRFRDGESCEGHAVVRNSRAEQTIVMPPPGEYLAFIWTERLEELDIEVRVLL